MYSCLVAVRQSDPAEGMNISMMTDERRGKDQVTLKDQATAESAIFSLLQSISMESSSSIVAQNKEPSLPDMNLLVAMAQGKRKGRSLLLVACRLLV